jgi:hypothetical protein
MVSHIGSMILKEQVQCLLDAGCTVDQINMALKTELIPALEAWRARQLRSLLQRMAELDTERVLH